MTENTKTPRILVGVDGSDSSIDALREAAVIAAALDAPLEAVTTWEYPVMIEYYPISGWSPEAGARAIIDDAIDRAFGDAAPSRLTTKIAHGSAARTLIELSNDARMLVLGSRGHGGFAGLLLGSVSAACAEHAHCPVLVVHRPISGPHRSTTTTAAASGIEPKRPRGTAELSA